MLSKGLSHKRNPFQKKQIMRTRDVITCLTLVYRVFLFMNTFLFHQSKGRDNYQSLNKQEHTLEKF